MAHPESHFNDQTTNAVKTAAGVANYAKNVLIGKEGQDVSMEELQPDVEFNPGYSVEAHEPKSGERGRLEVYRNGWHKIPEHTTEAAWGRGNAVWRTSRIRNFSDDGEEGTLIGSLGDGSVTVTRTSPDGRNSTRTLTGDRAELATQGVYRRATKLIGKKAVEHARRQADEMEKIIAD
jgi:hypothetical protein